VQSQGDKQIPYVTILDTGVNIAPPLLEPFIQATDQFTLDEDCTGADDHGHGTGMAGITAWGDDESRPARTTLALYGLTLLRNMLHYINDQVLQTQRIRKILFLW